jgi:hypothetical protein
LHVFGSDARDKKVTVCVKPGGVRGALCKGAFHLKAQPLSHRFAGSAAARLEDVEPAPRMKEYLGDIWYK